MKKKTALAIALASGLIAPAQAATYYGSPANYRSLVPGLQAGDTLVLAGGTYSQGLDVDNLNGSPSAWITITGPGAFDPQG